MLLDGILERNRMFVAGREARPLPDPEKLHLAVVGCYDPRLDPILPGALGLDTRTAFFLRAAGAVVRPDGDPLRSLALAAYLFGVEEVLVVGHTSCRMAAFPSAAFIEAFRARGVNRETFGPADLREWAGAIPDPKRGVAASVAAIAGAPFLPADLTVAGLVLDDSTGALQVVVPPARCGAAVAAPGPIASADPLTSTEALAPAAPSAPLAPASATSSADIPPEIAREIEALRAFVTALEKSAGWRDQLAQLRSDMERHPGAGARLVLVEKFLRRATVNTRGAAAAFDRLRTQTAATLRAPVMERVLDLFRPLGGQRKP